MTAPISLPIDLHCFESCSLALKCPCVLVNSLGELSGLFYSQHGERPCMQLSPTDGMGPLATGPSSGKRRNRVFEAIMKRCKMPIPRDVDKGSSRGRRARRAGMKRVTVSSRCWPHGQPHILWPLLISLCRSAAPRRPCALGKRPPPWHATPRWRSCPWTQTPAGGKRQQGAGGPPHSIAARAP